ncbi:SDR family oxidoreductase [Nocardia asteroides]|uniref:SDR family oxidoreductase n=1 Tax=Nocardia asteroides TaxID=1824 RepID=UPI001E2CA1F8|nr:SDR family oxidoreductase [Nocardia asteroides]
MAARGRRALTVRADSAEPADIAHAVERTAAELGGLDILVNNAGIFPAKPFAVFTLAEVDLALAVHPRAAFLYSMSKSALNGFTRAPARELGPREITVNVVQPGSTDTDMNPGDSGHADAQRALTALGRFGTATEVAETVAFLAGESGAHHHRCGAHRRRRQQRA